MNKILIESFDGLGDIIMSLPVARYYYNKGYEVDYIVKRYIIPLFDFVPYVKNVYYSNHYIDTNIYQCKFSIGGKLSQYHLETCRRHRTDASFILCDVDPKSISSNLKVPLIVIPTSYSQWASQFMKDNKINIVLSLISQSKYRTYFYFNELISLLDTSLFNIIFVHSRRIPINISNGINLTGKTNITQFISVVSKADIVLSVDTSTCQVAGALGVPLLAVFTTIPPEWRLKYFTKVKVVTPAIACSPCWDLTRINERTRRECVESQVPKCIQGISPKLIHAELLNFVKELNVFNIKGL